MFSLYSRLPANVVALNGRRLDYIHTKQCFVRPISHKPQYRFVLQTKHAEESMAFGMNGVLTCPFGAVRVWCTAQNLFFYMVALPGKPSKIKAWRPAQNGVSKARRIVDITSESKLETTNTWSTKVAAPLSFTKADEQITAFVIKF